MERGVQRWVVDISNWDPSPIDFSFALSFIPQHHHFSITRYMRWEDRKRALVSRLLQYALVHEVLRIPFEEIIIKRTIEGKPYLESDNIEFPNFNFNVSHHGDYVAIASEPLCLVGVDIVSATTLGDETIPEFLKNFSSYFSCLEWENIINAGSDDDILIEFYRYWCLKEAYVKAIGCGISNGLEKVEFEHDRWTNISLKINGVAMPTWKFWLFKLGVGHWASIARGHPSYATESYKKTQTQLEFTEEEYNNALSLPNLCFVPRTVDELIAIFRQTK